MRVIGVIDLLEGRAVHARGGVRTRYAPVGSVAGAAVDGDPRALARAYVDRFGIDEIYVADLDALLGGAAQTTIVRELAAVGATLWVDGAVQTRQHAVDLIAAGAAHVVVALETLRSMTDLAAIAAAAGSRCTAFSLDLRGGAPLGSLTDLVSPPDLAAAAAAAGASSIIVLDLARVGSGDGVDTALLARVHAAAPDLTLLAGGGVASRDDLRALAACGCDGALVASALIDGRISAADIAAVRRDSISPRA